MKNNNLLLLFPRFPYNLPDIKPKSMDFPKIMSIDDEE